MTKVHDSPPPISLLVTLLERAAIFALVLVARTIAAVVVVVALTIARGANRIKPVSIARVALSLLQSVAEPVFGRRGPIRRRPINRPAVIDRGPRRVLPRWVLA